MFSKRTPTTQRMLGTLRTGLVAGGSTAAFAIVALSTSIAAQADPLTYKEQQWIDQNGHVVCEQLAKDPTESGMLRLSGQMIMYYELGRSSANYIMGSIAQQCPQYRNLVPALRGNR